MFSPRIRIGITGDPNLQITSLDFTRNSLLKKVSPEQAHKPGNTVRTAVQLCNANGVYCTVVRHA
jgi:hypothetical protein